MVIDVNLKGVWLCMKYEIPAMLQHNGVIINMSSAGGLVGSPGLGAYTASKHAITGLTKSIALDGRAFNITCGQIDIGNASSDMTKKMAEGVLQADGAYRAEPTMKVEDVGRAVAYMASLPPETNIPFLTIMANGMSYVGRG